MSTKKYYLGAIALAAALLLLLASLQACQPAEPQATDTQAAGTEITGTLYFNDEDFIFDELPNQVWWQEGNTIHGRNLTTKAEGVYSDHRLDGQQVLTYNVDGIRKPGEGIYGQYWGHILILDPSGEKVMWEGDYTSEVDEEWNELATAAMHGRGDYAGLTATITYTSSPETSGQYAAQGMITEDE
jgi:hypothetical protein